MENELSPGYRDNKQCCTGINTARGLVLRPLMVDGCPQQVESLGTAVEVDTGQGSAVPSRAFSGPHLAGTTRTPTQRWLAMPHSAVSVACVQCL